MTGLIARHHTGTFTHSFTPRGKLLKPINLPACLVRCEKPRRNPHGEVAQLHIHSKISSRSCQVLWRWQCCELWEMFKRTTVQIHYISCESTIKSETKKALVSSFTEWITNPVSENKQNIFSKPQSITFHWHFGNWNWLEQGSLLLCLIGLDSVSIQEKCLPCEKKEKSKY